MEDLESCSRFRWEPVRWSRSAFEVNRHGMSAVVVGRHVYLLGGYDKETPREVWKTFVVDAAEEFKWRRLPLEGDLPDARSSHASWLHRDAIYVYGGKSLQAGWQWEFKSDLWRFDLALQEFSEMVPSGVDLGGRRGHSASVVEALKVCVVYGGNGGNGPMEELRCIDMETLHCSAPVPTGMSPGQMHDHGTCVVGNTIFLFGGYPSRFNLVTSGQILTLLHCTRSGLRWSQPKLFGAGAIPRWRWGSTLTLCGSRIYLVGGQTGGRYASRFHFLNISTRQWYTVRSDKYTPRTSLHVCVYANKKMLVCGGRPESSRSACFLVPYNHERRSFITEIPNMQVAAPNNT